MPLIREDVDEIYSHIKRKTFKLFGEIRTVAYVKFCRDVQFDIDSQIKREYGVSSFWEFETEDLADVHNFIDCYTLTRYLDEKIRKGK